MSAAPVTPAGPVAPNPGEAMLGDREPSRWSWRHADSVASAQLWSELANFVLWLDERYLRTMSAQALRLKPCWFRHPVAVEELTGLLASWQGAYCPGGDDPDAPGDAVAHWHLYGLWPTLLRLRDHAGWSECKPGAHKDRQTTNDPDLTTGLADFIDADVAKRPGPTLTLVEDFGEVALATLVLSRNDVMTMLEDGDAVQMLPGDPAAPVYIDGTWWSRPPLHAEPTYDADGNMELADRFQPVLADDIAGALDEHYLELHDRPVNEAFEQGTRR